MRGRTFRVEGERTPPIDELEQGVPGVGPDDGLLALLTQGVGDGRGVVHVRLVRSIDQDGDTAHRARGARDGRDALRHGVGRHDAELLVGAQGVRFGQVQPVVAEVGMRPARLPVRVTVDGVLVGQRRGVDHGDDEGRLVDAGADVGQAFARADGLLGRRDVRAGPGLVAGEEEDAGDDQGQDAEGDDDDAHRQLRTLLSVFGGGHGLAPP